MTKEYLVGLTMDADSDAVADKLADAGCTVEDMIGRRTILVTYEGNPRNLGSLDGVYMVEKNSSDVVTG